MPNFSFCFSFFFGSIANDASLRLLHIFWLSSLRIRNIITRFDTFKYIMYDDVFVDVFSVSVPFWVSSYNRRVHSRTWKYAVCVCGCACIVFIHVYVYAYQFNFLYLPKFIRFGKVFLLSLVDYNCNLQRTIVYKCCCYFIWTLYHTVHAHCDKNTESDTFIQIPNWSKFAYIIMQ